MWCFYIEKCICNIVTLYFVWFSLLTNYFQALANLSCTLCPHRYIILVPKLSGLSFSVVLLYFAHMHTHRLIYHKCTIYARVCVCVQIRVFRYKCRCAVSERQINRWRQFAALY